MGLHAAAGEAQDGVELDVRRQQQRQQKGKRVRQEQLEGAADAEAAGVWVSQWKQERQVVEGAGERARVKRTNLILIEFLAVIGQQLSHYCAPLLLELPQLQRAAHLRGLAHQVHFIGDAVVSSRKSRQ